MILTRTFIFVLLFLPNLSYSESLSYYKGYLLYKGYLEEAVPAPDFDQVIEGMKAAHDGLKLSDEEIKEKQSQLHYKAKEERLVEADRFMENLASQKDVVELVKGKLAYKIVKSGTGQKVAENDSPTLMYKATTLANGKEFEFNETDKPKVILLKSTISGFFQGVVGMREGEKRIIYIHPSLAYDAGTVFIEPNTQMIFEVEVIRK